jgi:hypothetical protein
VDGAQQKERYGAVGAKRYIYLNEYIVMEIVPLLNEDKVYFHGYFFEVFTLSVRRDP